MGSTTPITSLADWLSVNAGLKHLPDHVTSVIIATAACFIFQHVLSPAISSSLFPQTYPSLSKKTRRDWDVRFTAFMHAAYATAAALYVLNNPAIAPVLKADKVFAYQPQCVLFDVDLSPLRIRHGRSLRWLTSETFLTQSGRPLCLQHRLLLVRPDHLQHRPEGAFINECTSLDKLRLTACTPVQTHGPGFFVSQRSITTVCSLAHTWHAVRFTPWLASLCSWPHSGLSSTTLAQSSSCGE